MVPHIERKQSQLIQHKHHTTHMPWILLRQSYRNLREASLLQHLHLVDRLSMLQSNDASCFRQQDNKHKHHYLPVWSCSKQETCVYVHCVRDVCCVRCMCLLVKFDCDDVCIWVQVCFLRVCFRIRVRVWVWVESVLVHVRVCVCVHNRVGVRDCVGGCACLCLCVVVCDWFVYL